MDQSANQRRVFDKAGISDMVKNVVDVSIFISLTYIFLRVIMPLSLLMGKLVQEKPTQWKVIGIKPTIRGSQYL